MSALIDKAFGSYASKPKVSALACFPSNLRETGRADNTSTQANERTNKTLKVTAKSTRGDPFNRQFMQASNQQSLLAFANRQSHFNECSNPNDNRYSNMRNNREDGFAPTFLNRSSNANALRSVVKEHLKLVRGDDEIGSSGEAENVLVRKICDTCLKDLRLAFHDDGTHGNMNSDSVRVRLILSCRKHLENENLQLSSNRNGGMHVFHARNDHCGKATCFQFVKLRDGTFAQIRMMMELDDNQQIMALVKKTQNDDQEPNSVRKKRLGELATSKYYSTVFWRKNQLDAEFALVRMEDIIEPVVVHKVNPKYNLLSVNEVKDEQFDSFVTNEFLKPAGDN